MIPLYTQEQFENSSGEIKLPLQCLNCKKIFYKKKHLILRIINKSNFSHLNQSHTGEFCCIKCRIKYQKGDIMEFINCKNCAKNFFKLKRHIKKTPNHFCSSSCAAIYNNTHKQTGTKISKLEIWLQEQLSIQYPNLEIHYNRKDAINSELDIYIPSLKLAFELNGIFHYEPIYGAEKLQQIQNNDDRKFQACLEKGIELVIIDISSQKYFKEKTSKKYLEIILEIINIKSV
jgi:hypothetical protein